MDIDKEDFKEELKQGLGLEFCITQKIKVLELLAPMFSNPDELFAYYKKISYDEFLLPT